MSKINKMRKEITKEKYKLIVWTTVIVGLLANLIAGTLFIYSGIEENQMRLGFWMAISLLITGFGGGLAYARVWKVKGIDN